MEHREPYFCNSMWEFDPTFEDVTSISVMLMPWDSYRWRWRREVTFFLMKFYLHLGRRGRLHAPCGSLFQYREGERYWLYCRGYAGLLVILVRPTQWPWRWVDLFVFPLSILLTKEKVSTRTFIPALFDRLDECVDSIVCFVGRYDVVIHTDTIFLQVFFWEVRRHILEPSWIPCCWDGWNHDWRGQSEKIQQHIQIRGFEVGECHACYQ